MNGLPMPALTIGLLIAAIALLWQALAYRRESRELWERTARLAARAAVQKRKTDDLHGRIAEYHDCIVTNPAVVELASRMYGRKSA